MAHRVLHQRIELEKSVRRFRETFQGKVSLELAVLLMKRYNSNYSLVSKYVILMATDQDTGGLDADDRKEIEDDAVIKAVIEKLQDEENKAKTKNVVSKLTQKNLELFNLANAKSVPSEDRQFSCSQCDNYWWRRVPARKQVSRCRRCKQKYDPVPYDKMWGYAEFHCQDCGHVFGGFGQMGLPAPCYVCYSHVPPTRILPPKKSLGPRSPRPHSCFAEDCYNRREPHIRGTHCVHPRSRQRRGLPKVLYPSPAHDSTGSTINTCLSQGSLMECHVDDIIAEDILEEDEDTAEEDEDSTEKSDSVNNDDGD
ncbi:shiftless antiviral inhibitor of ribosomal frameshifting protein homolog [Pristis pectinata]|uniref:shiftless antiviral inhibitor of ribosomal frameshifting protein homolog n=1 Tax=Pristis pectinata TaxID=685728 RepID=UPI00223DF72F|nr:shiftless antiviral inhibitor of ribosomal frameshifting protein homolog [Pristis pectinata]XP_051898188.1 shiftless antiviral inhibitor of ribosomal frameshifting protein homolog [Pristis pectinata]